MSYTPITKLSVTLTIGGDLDLSHTQITKLPDNLTVGRDLDLSRTQITELPDNLTVGGNLVASARLFGCGISSEIEQAAQEISF